MAAAQSPSELFATRRRELFGLAYRLLGSPNLAQRTLEEVGRRWSAAAPPRRRRPEELLRQTAVRACLNALAAARPARRGYPGLWLPEPTLTPEPLLGEADSAPLRDSLALEALTELEALPPAERATVLLCRAYGLSHREAGEAVGVAEHAVRGMLRRSGPTLRFDAPPADPARAAERFLEAAQDAEARGELAALIDPRAGAWIDAGANSARESHPARGAAEVARRVRSDLLHPLAADARSRTPRLRVLATELNGRPGLAALDRDRPVAAAALRLDAGRLAAVHTVLNPHKLGWLARQLRRRA